ncbi:hypothetical protein QM787_04350 [Rhodococcus ruber]|uniref:Uncharacterized protein n=1 Tax=Rhodococcus ruber TaxID=1830 RepID=A0A098BUD9_9NOCA|nr:MULTISPECIES: hypothetical protein [Rhodococcus]MCD2127732.1 hypothetical protein [Rhodococcus ruber]MCZ1071683.1 hypothetical protein [Rhodococcus sp. A5(2022)]MCZ4504390.1 hypothetical protein [Rhodococcus ruber]MCZ4529374.1 hypothetical protein [Rhodococcus ruber]MCZ4621051.1 hypothetical protein [Rhodococcus ruber]
MTDARLPERLLNDYRVNSLAAEVWRSYTHSLMFAVSNRTDGHLTRAHLPMIPMFRPGDENILVQSGLWIDQGEGWWIDRFDLDQTTKIQLEAVDRKRVMDRERKRREREREKTRAERENVCGLPDRTVTRDVQRDNTVAMSPGNLPPRNLRIAPATWENGPEFDVTRDIRRDIKGQDRTGQDKKGEVCSMNEAHPDDAALFGWRDAG